jgi:hypothetical protein
VARGRLTQEHLDWALGAQRRTGVPFDEILVQQGFVTRHEIASLVLVCQLGSRWRDRVAARQAALLESTAPVQTAEPPVRPATGVPAGRPRTFALACLAVDVAMLILAALGTAWSRGGSGVAFPPAGWVALFCLLALGLYWAWRLYTFRVELRPLADALLIAGATGLAAMSVLTIRSLDGEAGFADAFLPLWAYAAVYGVAGRFAFYLWWSVRVGKAPDPVPADEEEETVEQVWPRASTGRAGPPFGRRMEVVPLRPEMWGLLDELRREVDTLVRERQAEPGGRGHDFAEAG